MREIIITAALMTASYIMYIFGIVYGVHAENMMIGEFCRMGSAFTAGAVLATERFRRMMADLLYCVMEGRNW